MKTKTINNILCAYLKIIPYQSGLLAVDEEAEKKCNDIVREPDGNIFTIQEYNTVTGIARDKAGIPFILAGSVKVLAAASSLNLPVWELPEKDGFAPKEILETEHKKFRDKYRESTSGDWQTYVLGLDAGYRAGSKSYSEEDMRKCFDAGGNYVRDDVAEYYGGHGKDHPDFKQFLSSLHPKGVWAEVEKEAVCIPSHPFAGDNSGEPEKEIYTFKITNNKLTVVERESNVQ